MQPIREIKNILVSESTEIISNQLANWIIAFKHVAGVYIFSKNIFLMKWCMF